MYGREEWRFAAQNRAKRAISLVRIYTYGQEE